MDKGHVRLYEESLIIDSNTMITSLRVTLILAIAVCLLSLWVTFQTQNDMFASELREDEQLPVPDHLHSANTKIVGLDAENEPMHDQAKSLARENNSTIIRENSQMVVVKPRSSTSDTTHSSASTIDRPAEIFSGTSIELFPLANTSKMDQPAPVEKVAIAYFSQARRDRGGAALLDMMRAHAWAMQKGGEYGGACIYGDGKENLVHKELITFLGLEKILKFDCPDRQNSSQIMLSNTVYLPPPMAELFTDDWLAFVRNNSHPSSMEKQPNSGDVYKVAVHVRRGDVSPCIEEWQTPRFTVDENNNTCRPHKSRYLPNQHYLQIIEKYVPKGANVTIYVESKQSAESLDDFKNFSMYIDGSLQTIWGDMQRSDMLILSKSTFAMIPAIVALKATQRVLFTPVSFGRIPNWEAVDCDILEATFRKMADFPRIKYCHLDASVDLTSTGASAGDRVERTRNQATRPLGLTSNHLMTTSTPLMNTSTTDRPAFLNNITTVFSQARNDRSGAALLDMMRAHAWSLKHGVEYGGACIYGDGKANVVQKELILFLGLEDILKFACPLRRNSSQISLSNTLYLLLPMDELFTDEWLAFIRSHTRSSSISPLLNASTLYQVAVHVRRGDISPCMWDDTPKTTIDNNNSTCQSHPARYLPNQHYIQIIERYAPKGANVTIYMESEQSAESLDDFKNFSMYVDGSLQTVWGDMQRSDMLILSKSTFAMIPAIVALKTTQRVLFTPVSFGKLRGWETVDCDILEDTYRKVNEYPRNDYCNKKVNQTGK